jgi:glycosyltransferase involved in cell wall biosynthesis
MKNSVLIIAHNEELHIAQCIESLLDQTITADEIIIVAHNSTDNTISIAQKYPVTVVVYNGPQGGAYARIRGMQEVNGDVILCIDGDCFAEKNWIEIMSHLALEKRNVLVGSWIPFKGNIFNRISSFFNKYACLSKSNPEYWLWGGSFGFVASHKEKVVTALEKSITLSQQLGLSRNPDDYWLALQMKQYGAIEITNQTFVTHYPKEQTLKIAWQRNRENLHNGITMHAYAKEHFDKS